MMVGGCSLEELRYFSKVLTEKCIGHGVATAVRDLTRTSNVSEPIDTEPIATSAIDKNQEPREKLEAIRASSCLTLACLTAPRAAVRTHLPIVVRQQARIA